VQNFLVVGVNSYSFAFITLFYVNSSETIVWAIGYDQLLCKLYLRQTRQKITWLCINGT